MMKANLSIRFYIKPSTVKTDRMPVYLRIIYSRKKAEHFTGIYLNEKNWNAEKQRAKKDNVINDKLSNIESEINQIHYSLAKENKPISSGIIKDLYTGKSSISTTLIQYFEFHISAIKQANELAKGSISRYEDTLDHLKSFLSLNKNTDLLIEQVDFKLLNDFDTYLKSRVSHITKSVLERNTVNKHHSRLRTVLIKAVRESQLGKNPYLDFKFKYTPSKRTFLTNEELDKIKNHDLGNNQSLIKVRDIFMFSVYTALRFQDAQSIKKNQIVIDKNGKPYLNLTQGKTKETISLPLLQPAFEIIKKYESGESKITGTILPRISNQKFNTYLKVIGDLTGIEKELSHHVARHTCATTILLSNDASMEAVSKWLGHTNIRTTQIYAKITNEYLQSVANKISEKL